MRALGSEDFDLFETNEFTGEVGVVRDSFYQNQQNPKAQKRKTVIGTENRCMVIRNRNWKFNLKDEIEQQRAHKIIIQATMNAGQSERDDQLYQVTR